MNLSMYNVTSNQFINYTHEVFLDLPFDLVWFSFL